jgi:putative ABC transport system ATP-binding protein
LGDRDIQMLKGLSFEVAHGEWLAATGPSGSGKSTLLDLLAGIARS